MAVKQNNKTSDTVTKVVYRGTYPISDIKGVDVVKDPKALEEDIALPVTSFKELGATEKALPNDTAKVFSEADTKALGIAFTGAQLTVENDMLSEAANRESMTNIVEGAKKGSTVGIKSIQIKPKQAGRLHGAAARGAIYSFLGVGAPTQIPLYNSGFRITIGTIGSTERVALNQRLSKAHQDIGGDTAGLIFSNDMVALADIIMDFIEDNMIDTTLKIGDDERIRDYIKVSDFLPMALGLIKAMAPSGFDIATSCENTIEVNEDGTGTKCNNIVRGKANPELLLRVDEDILTPTARTIINRAAPATVEKSDLDLYLGEITYAQDVEKKYRVNGNTMKITYSVPTMDRYIQFGKLWINLIEEQVDELIMDEDDTSKSAKIAEISKVTVLNTYSHYISKIDVGNNTFISEDNITETLSAISLDAGLTKEVLKDMKDFVNVSPAAIVGVPAYRCETCQKEVEGNPEARKPFKNIIPLNVIRLFFVLNSLNSLRLENALTTES